MHHARVARSSVVVSGEDVEVDQAVMPPLTAQCLALLVALRALA